MRRQLPHGVTRLKSLRRLDLTIKAIVHHNPKFQARFSQKLCRTAEPVSTRFVKLGYI